MAHAPTNTDTRDTRDIRDTRGAHLGFDQVHHRLVVDEMDVLELDLLVEVHRLLFLERVPAGHVARSFQKTTTKKRAPSSEKTASLSPNG